LTAEERLVIADKLTTLENANLNLKRLQLTAELALLKAQAAREKADKGEVSDAINQQINATEVALENAEASSVALTEKVAVRRLSIVTGEEARKEAIRQKAREARKKAEEEEAKNAEQRVQAQAKLDDVLNGLADDRLARTQTDAEKEITATEKKYADFEKVAKEGIQKLREASPPGAEAAIAQQEANILVQIETAKQEELTQVRQKAAEDLAKEREEGREQLRKTLLDDTELQREAILEQFDADVALAEKSIENLEERNETIRKLTEQAQKELTAIVTTEEQKRIDAETAAAEQRAALQQANLDLVKSFAEQSLATLVQSAAEGKGLQEEAAKQLLVLLLDTVEKIVLLNAINAQTGAIALGFSTGNPAAGIIAGIAVTAIIKGLFAAVKSSILGNYKGDDFVGGDGSRPMWNGRDGFLRRLDYGERVVTGKTNAKYYDEMQAMEDGNWDRYLDNNYILPAIESIRYNDDERAVKFVQTDMGQRMAASITLPRMFDKNIVESQLAQSKEQRRTNKLLEEMVHNTRARTTNNRYY
jgi:chemotaxis protein histidine kinase CheA